MRCAEGFMDEATPSAESHYKDLGRLMNKLLALSMELLEKP